WRRPEGVGDVRRRRSARRARGDARHADGAKGGEPRTANRGPLTPRTANPRTAYRLPRTAYRLPLTASLPHSDLPTMRPWHLLRRTGAEDVPELRRVLEPPTHSGVLGDGTRPARMSAM